VVLVLPLIQLLREKFPGSAITAVVIPAAAGLLANHPAVSRVIVYDKKGADSGLPGFLRTVSRVRAAAIDVALIPHRSLRSALLCRLAGIPLRIGFDTSAGGFLLTRKVGYVAADHEIQRNLALAVPLGVATSGLRLPRLYPSEADRRAVDAFLARCFGPAAVADMPRCIAVAPGSVWNTKRWPESKFLSLIRSLLGSGWHVVLVGGVADRDLCSRLAAAARDPRLADSSGMLSLLESAQLIGRCAALVSNDSAPVHLAVAMGIPVVAIFGPTLPSFGFAPPGPGGRVVESTGLWCRPCSIHGGNRCPTGTFDCMNLISAGRVREEILALVRPEV
jgi:heptosyltransferase II